MSSDLATVDTERPLATATGTRMIHEWYTNVRYKAYIYVTIIWD